LPWRAGGFALFCVRACASCATRIPGILMVKHKASDPETDLQVAIDVKDARAAKAVDNRDHTADATNLRI